MAGDAGRRDGASLSDLDQTTTGQEITTVTDSEGYARAIWKLGSFIGKQYARAEVINPVDWPYPQAIFELEVAPAWVCGGE